MSVRGWSPEWFLTLCELGSMSATADALGVPQSTLSRRLQRLEYDVGTSLFDRAAGGLRINSRGEVLREHLSKANAELVAGVEAVRRISDPDRGTIRFDFLHSLSTWLMPRLVRGHLSRRPGVEFVLHQGPGVELSERVAAGISDIAIATPRPTDPDLDFVLLASERQGLAVPRDHRLATRRRIRLAEVADEPFATLLPGYGTRQVFDELCDEGGFTPRIVFEAGEIPTAGGLVSAGLALAVVPLGYPSMKPEGTVIVPLQTRIRREIGVVRNIRAAPNPPVEEFWTHVTSEAPSLLGETEIAHF
ncbi:LysR family transcriptional regulator [Dietzia timorensis]|uniref:Putative HTH-type transcriptional regulator YybE n=1 Tax=Dietzia timorensis TaxID=499555 RepID=A0A173LKQ1_9ACTN|nr:LysR family transcriptional regulator [Dietzia timorensis]ANI92098.1 putative HTH-type transcriptional regulator YybE [Dietzia timorensis]